MLPFILRFNFSAATATAALFAWTSVYFFTNDFRCFVCITCDSTLAQFELHRMTRHCILLQCLKFYASLSHSFCLSHFNLVSSESKKTTFLRRIECKKKTIKQKTVQMNSQQLLFILHGLFFVKYYIYFAFCSSFSPFSRFTLQVGPEYVGFQRVCILFVHATTAMDSSNGQQNEEKIENFTRIKYMQKCRMHVLNCSQAHIHAQCEVHFENKNKQTKTVKIPRTTHTSIKYLDIVKTKREWEKKTATPCLGSHMHTAHWRTAYHEL